MEKRNQTVQHIRIDRPDHVAVKSVAEEEFRSIAEQYRKIIREWCEARPVPEGGAL